METAAKLEGISAGSKLQVRAAWTSLDLITVKTNKLEPPLKSEPHPEEGFLGGDFQLRRAGTVGTKREDLNSARPLEATHYK